MLLVTRRLSYGITHIRTELIHAHHTVTVRIRRALLNAETFMAFQSESLIHRK